jgi:acetylornithine deacetylase/succinyl-diaminopimelate desuccinylase-like protein
MTTSELLDNVVTPRPNGSDGLLRVASFIERTLRDHGAAVTLEPFTATPYGFQLLFLVALLLTGGFALATARGRDGVALLIALAVGTLLFVEAELLWMPLSGLLPLREHNIVATYRGAPDSPTLVFSAHYDTATQFGDHVVWSRWAPAQVAAMVAMLAWLLFALWSRRRGRAPSRGARVVVSALVVVPFAAFAWFFSAGPLLQTPSPGALDNGGSVTVLLRLAERLSARSAGAPTTVTLVFFASEEERALGSWAHAKGLSRNGAAPLAAINLELIGAGDGLAYVAEEGFAFWRYANPPGLVAFVDEVARLRRGEPLEPRSVPRVGITDARSFLAHGLPALTLLPDSGWPRHLHSGGDSRDRIRVPALESAVEFLAALVAHADRDPAGFARRQRAGP